MTYKILHGDCLDLLPTITEPIAAVVTDPPWGVKNRCNYSRFSGGKSKSRDYEPIANDDQPFDPSPWLNYDKVVLWGYQHFAQHLPPGTILIWNKRRDNTLGKFLSDAEIAWMKGGCGTYLFNHVWSGFDRDSERGEKSLHPSQKPVELFKWVLGKLKLKPGDTVLDPYCGSGPVGAACLEMKLNYIGIDVEESFVEITNQRLKQKEQECVNSLSLSC